MVENLLLEMKNIHKQFPGVYALKDANLHLLGGEVHALLGENGAGKSTLIKILGGIYQKDQGDIFIDKQLVTINNVEDARREGVSIIHQELVLAPYLTIAENIFLGREPLKRSGFLDQRKMKEQTHEILCDFGLDLHPNTLVADLNIAQQQMVEIVKAISFQAKIIVMDEPTSSLSDKEVASLFESIRLLTSKGIGIIYISHRMSELNQIADRVTVMRDGEMVGTKVVAETDNDELISLMVGRPLTNYYTRTFNECSECLLKVDNLKSNHIKGVSFDLKKGEILGFAGLIGAGRSETMRALFGIDKVLTGSVKLEGKELTGLPTNKIMKNGISMVPEDRKHEGVFLDMPIQFNLTLKVLQEFIKWINVDHEKERLLAEQYMNQLSVKAADLDVDLWTLSGGNQQKVIIGSWLASHPKVLILDEPTRGIDVGAKSEIYSIMNELAKQGMSIIMVSSDLQEVLNMSDRVVVMRDGQISKILDRQEASQETIMQFAVKH